MHLKSRRVVRLTASLCLAILAFGLVSSVFAQDAAAPAGAAAGGEKKEKTAFAMLWDVAKTPPYVFFLLIGCSIFTFTLIPERYMFYRKAGGNADEMVLKIKQAGTLSDALTAIENAPGVAGTVIRAALTASRDGYTPEQVEQLVQGTVTKELISMEKFLPQLDSMVTLCPLIGLLGTTVGMIRSFSIIAAIGMSDPTKLAGGISEALINTASGLAVAIPALFAYNYFTGKKEAILMDMERGLSEIMVILKQSAEG